MAIISTEIKKQVQFSEERDGDYIVKCDPYWVTFSKDAAPFDGFYYHYDNYTELSAPADAPTRMVRVTVETIE